MHTAGTPPPPPPPRHSHAAVVHGDALWLFGGVDAFGSPAVALHRLALPDADATALPKCEVLLAKP